MRTFATDLEIKFIFKQNRIMKITIDRKWAKAGYTVGRLYVDGKLLCNTLEPPLKGNGSHPKGAIPRGVYGVEVTWSPRFRRMLPLVCGVPGFSGIRIHAGNTVSDTMGCILVGWNTDVGRLTSSRAALEKLLGLINDARERKESITITIK